MRGGTKLLETSVEASIAAGRYPILDVWTELDGAIALYERSGWRPTPRRSDLYLQRRLRTRLPSLGQLSPVLRVLGARDHVRDPA